MLRKLCNEALRVHFSHKSFAMLQEELEGFQLHEVAQYKSMIPQTLEKYYKDQHWTLKRYGKSGTRKNKSDK